MKTYAVMALALAGTLAAQTNVVVTETKTNYTNISTNLLKGAEKMPESAYSFRPVPEERTFGELVGHIADAQTRICSSATGTTKAADSSKLTAKADLVAALKASFDLCDSVFASTNNENAMSMVPMGRGGAQRSRIGTLNYDVVHNNESYGTMVVYLRLKGIVPPSSEPKK